MGEAIDSLLAQAYENFEIVVCDNDSKDDTVPIVRERAATDGRIRLVRNDRNLGGAANFNRAFELSTGEYFKWMAHDDLCRPHFLDRCVQALDEDPMSVLAYPSPLQIDEDGEPVGPRNNDMRFTKATAFARFRDQMVKPHAALHLFGLIRSDILRRTQLLGRYPGSDRVLLAELALYGKFHEVREPLFLHREHAGRGSYSGRSPQAMMAWFDPDTAGRVSFPHWRLLQGYLTAVRNAQLHPQERARCYVQMLGWCKGKRSDLMGDLRYAVTFLLRRDQSTQPA